jgi:hypothetical protein
MRGRYFAHTGAKLVTSQGLPTGKGSSKIHKRVLAGSKEGTCRVGRSLVIPSRAEVVVKLPVAGQTRDQYVMAEQETQVVYLGRGVGGSGGGQ